MWNLTGIAPQIVEARELTRLPDHLRRPVRSDWAEANKPGEVVDCFLEGPAFDREGNLYVTDIPHGRILRVSPSLEWSLVAETAGWPNGIAIHRDGRLFVADYRYGILTVDPSSGRVDPVLAHRSSEGFKGVNDLVFASDGSLLFTDQGQTGLHDPTGRVFRSDPSGRLDCLIANGPSPNGIAISPDGRFLYVAMTRSNSVWRGPMQSDGSITKVGAFRTFFGTSGPDGLAIAETGELVASHASLGCAIVCKPNGEISHLIVVPGGRTVTNVAFRPGSREIVLTESHSGTVFAADVPFGGLSLFSHSG